MGTSGANVSIRRTRTERGLGDDLHSDLEQHREQLHSAARPPDGAPNGPAEVSSNDGGYPGLPRPLPPRLDDAGGPAGDNVDASAERDPSTSGKVGGEIARSALSIVRRCGRSWACKPVRPRSLALPIPRGFGRPDLVGHPAQRVPARNYPEPSTSPWGFKSMAQAVRFPRDSHQALRGEPRGFKSVSKLSTCSEQGEHRVDVSEGGLEPTFTGPLRTAGSGRNGS